MTGMDRVAERFISLKEDGCCIVEYVWIDGTGEQMRSKSRTLTKVPQNVEGNLNENLKWF